MYKCFAFDCFGTVFDMESVPLEEIQEYVRHVRKNDFSPYTFPESWRNLKAHPDAKDGIAELRKLGIHCVTLSNGQKDLLEHISNANGIVWDKVIDLAAHRVYKPHVDAYRVLQKETGFPPAECLMVTANPLFGDVEGSAAIGMTSVVIRKDEGRRRDIQTLADASRITSFYLKQMGGR